MNGYHKYFKFPASTDKEKRVRMTNLIKENY